MPGLSWSSSRHEQRPGGRARLVHESTGVPPIPEAIRPDTLPTAGGMTTETRRHRRPGSPRSPAPRSSTCSARSTGCARPSAGRPAASTRPGCSTRIGASGADPRRAAQAPRARRGLLLHASSCAGESPGEPWDAVDWDADPDWEFDLGRRRHPERALRAVGRRRRALPRPARPRRSPTAGSTSRSTLAGPTAATPACGGCSSTSSRSTAGTPATPTCSARRSTVVPARTRRRTGVPEGSAGALDPPGRRPPRRPRAAGPASPRCRAGSAPGKPVTSMSVDHSRL